MLHKLKMLFLLVPIFLLTGCGENDPIFQNLDGNGKLIYIGIILGLGLIGGILQFIFKKRKANKQTGSSSQPTAPQIPQHQTLAPPPPAVQQSSMPQQSTMPPIPSNEMVNELSKMKPEDERKETA
jgi:hypothetical protein